MASSPVVVIGFTFRDRDANVAKLTMYTAWTLAITDVWLLADYLLDAIIPLSDGVISKVDLLLRWKLDDPLEALESADLSRKLLVFVTNDAGDINGLIIPSTIDVFESAGAYAGIRADLTNAALVQLQAALAELPYATDDNRELGSVIAAAGLAL